MPVEFPHIFERPILKQSYSALRMFCGKNNLTERIIIMKKINTAALARAAILLAICIISQFFKNLSVYITGPIINTCLIICVLTAGLSWAIALSVITPITSFIITGSPIMAAIPLIIPCVMIGNIILTACVYFFKKKVKKNYSLPLSLLVGSLFKAAFMGAVISSFIIPMLLPEAMAAKKAVFQTTFSVTQLITSLIGSTLALVIYIPLKKIIAREQ